jgi:hypothetical protein
MDGEEGALRDPFWNTSTSSTNMAHAESTISGSSTSP